MIELLDLQRLTQQVYHSLLIQRRLSVIGLVASTAILVLVVAQLILQWKIRRVQAERHKYVAEAIDAIIEHQGFLDRRLTAIETGTYIDPGDEGI